MSVSEQDAKRFRRFVSANYWQFAKTYAAFCPHEYTLKKWDKTGDFMWFCQFVWDHGFNGRYGKNPAHYFIDEETGYYYFVPPADTDGNGKVKPEMTLINRSTLKEFEFIPEETMFGTEYVVKRLPPEKREKWY